MWVTFAIDKGVKNLDFGFSSYNDILPRCVFTSQSLVILSLSGVKLEDQTQVHLGNLRKLSLLFVRGSDQAFERLISGCRSLLKLTIDKAKGLQNLNISNPSVVELFLGVEHGHIALNSPALKMLDIVYDSSSSSCLLEVTDVTSLEEVNVEIVSCYRDFFMALISQFQCVKVLSLTAYALSRLSSLKTYYPPNRLERLVLHSCWSDERCLQIIFDLVAASVKLEDLEIYSGYTRVCEFSRMNFPLFQLRIINLYEVILKRLFI
ncbi:hypothetical protein RND81_01G171300 [Saponaria officinalis]|uniref:F-box/LRR-repeat protein 15/At3g58940/PEG3-like LRR domain-containing protein n=1 Tax=Saponaria officinalis TaxID=3572 RepID=A0AAW1NGP6_SAPOF